MREKAPVGRMQESPAVYREEAMEKKRKAVLTGFIIFLLFMGICSLVTKGIYKAGLPQVTTTAVREMSLYHQVSAVGSVAPGQEYGIYAPEGLRVAAIAVQKGESFQAGAPLLQLDVEDMERILAGKELERQRLIYQLQAAEEENTQSRLESAKTLTRAQEDYETARRDGELQVSRAREVLAAAQAELQEAAEELEALRKRKEQDEAAGVSGGSADSVSCECALRIKKMQKGAKNRKKPKIR